MIKKRLSYTIVIANHASAKMWRLSVAPRMVATAAIFAIIGFISTGFAAYHYSRMLGTVTDYYQLLKENDAFRSENHNYRIQTAQLGEKLDFLDTMSLKLARLSGINSETGLGGVGGFSKSNLEHRASAAAGTLQSVDAYNKRVDALENRYSTLEQYFSEKSLVDAARPAFLPVKGYVTAGMGRREDPFNASASDFHTGVDISAPHGTRVIAPADGTVIFAGRREGYGNIVVVDHKFGVTTRYGHLFKFNVQVGQRVSRYDVIGYVGNTGRSTGPHLHFEMWMMNRAVNPVKTATSKRERKAPARLDRG